MTPIWKPQPEPASLVQVTRPVSRKEGGPFPLRRTSFIHGADSASGVDLRVNWQEPIAMRHMPRTLSSAAAAALLVTSVASPADARRYRHRSEEHTSELQSLMRNSYAVFCLKKKKHTPKKT